MVDKSAGDKKRTTRQLQEALDYAESIISTIREPLLVLDSGLRIISANKSFYREFSADPAETEGKIIYEIADGQWNIPILRELLDSILSRNTSFENYEVDLELPHLGRRSLLLNARHVRNGGEKTQRILLAIEDITERQRLGKEMASSELRYRRLFETAQDGILILEAQTGEITDANPFISAILGYSRQELVGKRLWEIGFFKDAAASQKAFKVLQEEGYVRYEDLPLKTREGRSIQVEFVSNLYSVNGDKVMQCNIRDITERKKAEQMRDEFLGIISHELKTPMTVIMGSLFTAIAEGVSDEQIRELIGEALMQVEMMANLVDNLLELARQQSSRLVLQTRPVNIGDVTREVIKRLEGISPIHHITCYVPQSIPPALADSLRVERILHNLIDNAIKYSPNGGEVTVNARPDGDFLVVSVSDQGPGISLDDQSKLFQSFARLGEKGNANIIGTGLGLRVCRILVEAHRGRIWVESQKGQGSTFFFTLPASVDGK